MDVIYPGYLVMLYSRNCLTDISDERTSCIQRASNYKFVHIWTYLKSTPVWKRHFYSVDPLDVQFREVPLCCYHTESWANINGEWVSYFTNVSIICFPIEKTIELSTYQEGCQVCTSLNDKIDDFYYIANTFRSWVALSNPRPPIVFWSQGVHNMLGLATLIMFYLRPMQFWLSKKFSERSMKVYF